MQKFDSNGWKRSTERNFEMKLDIEVYKVPHYFAMIYNPHFNRIIIKLRC